VKIRLLALCLLAGSSCATPLPGNKEGGHVAGPDMARPAVGGNGDDDMATSDGPDLAMTNDPPDLAQPIPPDLAQPIPPDLAQPIPPDLAQPIPPDLAVACKPPTGSACVVYPQCGCSSSQECDITDPKTGNMVCVAAGTVPPWNACTGSGQCQPGSSCVFGVCTPFCDTVAAPSSECSAGECYQLNNNNTPIPNDKLCSLNCDPTSPQSSTGGFSPCGPGVNCLPDTDKYAFCYGQVKSSGTQGADCLNLSTGVGDQTRCAVGFICNTTDEYCNKMCHVGKTGECASGLTCKSQNPKVYAGTAEIGGCHS
jgi:hypothetical protein